MAFTIPDSTYDANLYFGGKAAPKKKELDMQAFLQLLTAQLANQNPMEPMNDRDFFAQMAQLGQVQGMDNLQKSLDVAQASSLMGKTVTAYNPMTTSESATNELVTGKVEKLTLNNGEYKLTLKKEDGTLVDVSIRHIKEVTS